MTFQNIHAFFYFWILPLFMAGFAWTLIRRRWFLIKFIDLPLLSLNKISFSSFRNWLKAVLLWASLILIIVALARPGYQGKPKSKSFKGRDVVFVLDVSKSMLARDVSPDRFNRAKSIIMDSLRQMEGNRIGLVAFAGSAVVKCPLTMDYGFFKMVLSDLGCESISLGGTMVGNALQKTIDVFTNPREKLDVILITDGEDHEYFAANVARQAGERGTRLIVLGLGDETNGARIPVYTENGAEAYLTYKGKEIWTKMNPAVLRDIASAAPHGRFFNVGTGIIDLGAVYKELTSHDDITENNSNEFTPFEEMFQYFLLPAFLLLSFEFLLSNRKRAYALTLTIGLWCIHCNTQATSIDDFVINGNKAHRAGNYAQALSEYDKALKTKPDSSVLHFNRGTTLYHLGDYEQAEKAFRQTDNYSDDRIILSKSQFCQGNCAFKQAESLGSNDIKQALLLGEKSLRHLQKALVWDPTNVAASQNIEIIRTRLNSWQEELQKKELEEIKKKKQAEQLKKMIERQKQAIQQNQNLKKDFNKNGASSTFKKQMDQLAQDQQTMSQQSQQMAQAMQCSSSGSSSESTLKNNKSRSKNEAVDKNQSANKQERKTGDSGNDIEASAKSNSETAKKDEPRSRIENKSAQEQLSQASQEQANAAQKLEQNKLDPAGLSQSRALELLENTLIQLQLEMSDKSPFQQPRNEKSAVDKSENATPTSSVPPFSNLSENINQDSSGQNSPMINTPQQILNEEKQNRSRWYGNQFSGHNTTKKDW